MTNRVSRVCPRQQFPHAHLSTKVGCSSNLPHKNKPPRDLGNRGPREWWLLENKGTLSTLHTALLIPQQHECREPLIEAKKQPRQGRALLSWNSETLATIARWAVKVIRHSLNPARSTFTLEDAEWRPDCQHRTQYSHMPRTPKRKPLSSVYL